MTKIQTDSTIDKVLNKSISSSQTKILHILKLQGNITANDIAPQVNMTSMGARQHLESLEQQGYVKHLFNHAGRGRPKKLWQITDKGQTLFPDAHSSLLVNLLGHMKQQLGDEALDNLIICRETEMLKDYHQALSPLATLEEKLLKLAEIRTKEGYMASYEKYSNDSSGDQTGWLFIENHCPICSAAKQCQQFCRSEKSIFETVLQTSVKRVEYILEGNRRCCYEVASYDEKSDQT